ncbi:MAG: RES domain-containing protein [Bacteroidota bacterium]
MAICELIISTIEANKDNPDLYEILLKLFIEIGVPIQSTSLTNAVLYRARRNENHIDFKKTSKISYPKNEYVEYFGRVNRPGQNMFYSSDIHDTCEAELLPYLKSDNKLIGEIIPITLGKWVLTKPIRVLVIPDSSNPCLAEYLSKVIEFDISDEERLFFDFISSYFKKTHNEINYIYKITTAYSNAAFQYYKLNNQNVDGILYTSVHTIDSFNIALFPHVIDSSILKLGDILKVFYEIDANYKLIDRDSIKPKCFCFEKDYIKWK